MPEYQITDKAGPYVAGRRNTGTGTKMFLTPREAEHDLRTGALIKAAPTEVPPVAQSGRGRGRSRGGASA